MPPTHDRSLTNQNKSPSKRYLKNGKHDLDPEESKNYSIISSDSDSQGTNPQKISSLPPRNPKETRIGSKDRDRVRALLEEFNAESTAVYQNRQSENIDYLKALVTDDDRIKDNRVVQDRSVSKNERDINHKEPLRYKSDRSMERNTSIGDKRQDQNHGTSASSSNYDYPLFRNTTSRSSRNCGGEDEDVPREQRRSRSKSEPRRVSDDPQEHYSKRRGAGSHSREIIRSSSKELQSKEDSRREERELSHVGHRDDDYDSERRPSRDELRKGERRFDDEDSRNGNSSSPYRSLQEKKQSSNSRNNARRPSQVERRTDDHRSARQYVKNEKYSVADELSLSSNTKRNKPRERPSKEQQRKTSKEKSENILEISESSVGDESVSDGDSHTSLSDTEQDRKPTRKERRRKENKGRQKLKRENRDDRRKDRRKKVRDIDSNDEKRSKKKGGGSGDSSSKKEGASTTDKHHQAILDLQATQEKLMAAEEKLREKHKAEDETRKEYEEQLDHMEFELRQAGEALQSNKEEVKMLQKKLTETLPELRKLQRSVNDGNEKISELEYNEMHWKTEIVKAKTETFTSLLKGWCGVTVHGCFSAWSRYAMEQKQIREAGEKHKEALHRVVHSTVAKVIQAQVQGLIKTTFQIWLGFVTEARQEYRAWQVKVSSNLIMQKLASRIGTGAAVVFGTWKKIYMTRKKLRQRIDGEVVSDVVTMVSKISGGVKALLSESVGLCFLFGGWKMVISEQKMYRAQQSEKELQQNAKEMEGRLNTLEHANIMLKSQMEKVEQEATGISDEILKELEERQALLFENTLLKDRLAFLRSRRPELFESGVGTPVPNVEEPEELSSGFPSHSEVRKESMTAEECVAKRQSHLTRTVVIPDVVPVQSAKTHWPPPAQYRNPDQQQRVTQVSYATPVQHPPLSYQTPPQPHVSFQTPPQPAPIIHTPPVPITYTSQPIVQGYVTPARHPSPSPVRTVYAQPVPVQRTYENIENEPVTRHVVFQPNPRAVASSRPEMSPEPIVRRASFNNSVSSSYPGAFAEPSTRRILYNGNTTLAMGKEYSDNLPDAVVRRASFNSASTMGSEYRDGAGGSQDDRFATFSSWVPGKRTDLNLVHPEGIRTATYPNPYYEMRRDDRSVGWLVHQPHGIESKKTRGIGKSALAGKRSKKTESNPTFVGCCE